MLVPASHIHSAAAHTREDERLHDQLAGLAALVAFPAAKLPRDLAASIGAAVQAAQERIGELLPRYCGFGLGEVVDVAGAPATVSAARVETVFINEGGSASILLRPISADGSEHGQHLQFPLFYARTALRPSGTVPEDPAEPCITPSC